MSELVNALPENYATQCIPLASLIVQQYSDNSFVTQACVMKLIQNMLAKTGDVQLAEYSKTYIEKFFQTIQLINPNLSYDQSKYLNQLIVTSTQVVIKTKSDQT